MRGTTRYILRQLAGPLIFLTLSLFGIVWLVQSLRFVSFIINKGVSAGMFLYLTSLVMPALLALILPVALFCAVLYTYHRLSTESELLVLRAAGLSQGQLARPALLMAGIVMVVLYALTLFLAPAGQRELMNLRFEIRNNYSLILLQEGVFSTVAPNITVYVRERMAGGELQGILVYDNRVRERPVTMMAERGALVRSDQGPRFVLVNGNRQTMDGDRRNLSLLYFDKYTMDLRPYTQDAAARWREPDERYFHELFRPPQSADDIQQASRIRTEAHRRLSGPVYALALTVIAVASLLSGDYNRRGQWRRMLAAAAAAIALEALSLGLMPVASTAPWLWPLLYAVPLAACGAGLYLMSDRGRRPQTQAATAAGGG